MSAGWVVGVAGIALFLFFAWLALGCPVPSRGRHRRGRLSGLLTAVKRYYGFGSSAPRFYATIEAVQGNAVITTPVVVGVRCPSDDWMSDPPTVELPVVEPESTHHTSPSESLRGTFEVDSPIFMALAKPLGFDPVRGFDALFTVDGLVPA